MDSIRFDWIAPDLRSTLPLARRYVFQNLLLERRLLRPDQGVHLFSVDQKDKEGQRRGSVGIGQVLGLVNFDVVERHKTLDVSVTLGSLASPS